MSTVDGCDQGPSGESDFWTDAGDEFDTVSPEQLTLPTRPCSAGPTSADMGASERRPPPSPRSKDQCALRCRRVTDRCNRHLGGSHDRARLRCVAVVVGVREAGVDDLDSLVSLRRAWANEDGHLEEPGFEQRFAAWFHREESRRRFWLAEDSGTPVGFANLLLFDRMPNPGTPPAGWGYLGNMYVAPSHRDAGVGSLIVATISEFADALGLRRIVLNPSVGSVAFYQRAGFVAADTLMLRPHDRAPDDST